MHTSLKKVFVGSTVISLLVSLFPWFCSFSGNVRGFHVSVRALGDEIALAFVLLGLSLLFSKKFQGYARSIGNELNKMDFKKKWGVIAGFTLLYSLGILSHKLRAQYSLGTHAHDLGFLSNICWNTKEGNWFYSSLYERNFMSIHTHWLLWPLSFLYQIYEGASTLLVVHVVFIAIALPFVWRSVEKIVGSFSGGLLGTLMFVCSPYIGHTLGNDFKAELWVVPTLMASLWAFQNKKPFLVILFSSLSLLVKEDASIVLIGFGLFLWFQKSWWRVGTIIILIATGAFLFETQYFIPRFIPSGTKSLLFGRYPLLGDSFGSMLKNLFFHPSVYWQAFLYEPSKFWRLACYIFPGAGLSLLCPSWLFPPLVSVMPHLLSQAGTQLSLADLYAMPSQAFLVFGSAFGAKKIMERLESPRILQFCGICLIVCGLGVWNTPKFYRTEPASRLKVFYELQKLIPPKASLATQQNLFPHFETRRFIQFFPMTLLSGSWTTRQLMNPDFIFCDRIGNALPFNGKDLKTAIEDLERDSRYSKLIEKENFLVFKRKSMEDQQWMQNDSIN